MSPGATPSSDATSPISSAWCFAATEPPSTSAPAAPAALPAPPSDGGAGAAPATEAASILSAGAPLAAVASSGMRLVWKLGLKPSVYRLRCRGWVGVAGLGVGRLGGGSESGGERRRSGGGAAHACQAAPRPPPPHLQVDGEHGDAQHGAVDLDEAVHQLVALPHQHAPRDAQVAVKPPFVFWWAGAERRGLRLGDGGHRVGRRLKRETQVQARAAATAPGTAYVYQRPPP
jgi:hypothetical protein